MTLYLPTRGSARIFSFGGGVQSTAVMVLQSLGQIKPYDYFVFSNVGDDSENPATLDYINRVIKPYAMAYDLPFVETHKTTRGKPETLLQYIYRTKRSIPLPIWLESAGHGNRACTADFKIRVVDRWIRAQGFSHAVIGLGISTDEYQRARDLKWHDRPARYKKKNGLYTTPKPFGYWKKREYPLIDLNISRQGALNLIQRAGLPEPPRSACWFCPFTSRSRWIERKTYQPELFKAAIDLENMINVKRQSLGRDKVYLHRDCKPLAAAVPDQMPLPLFFDPVGVECDSGYCFI